MNVNDFVAKYMKHWNEEDREHQRENLAPFFTDGEPIEIFHVDKHHKLVRRYYTNTPVRIDIYREVVTSFQKPAISPYHSYSIEELMEVEYIDVYQYYYKLEDMELKDAIQRAKDESSIRIKELFGE